MKMLAYSDIPNEAFIKALKVRDIRRARILSRQEKNKLKAGSPDVVLESPLGFIDNIDRNMFVKLYKHINGGKIKLVGWKYTHKYIVVSADNTEVYSMYVPPKYSIKINKSDKTIIANKSQRAKGDYIVCGMNQDGTINREQVYCINSIMYRKMFITSNRTEYLGNTRKTKQAPIKPAPKQENVGIAQSNEEYTAVAQLIHNGKLVGVIIQDYAGRQKNIDKALLMALCQDKKITNICVVEQNGSKFIRGVGIKISDLPICPV